MYNGETIVSKVKIGHYATVSVFLTALALFIYIMMLISTPFWIVSLFIVCLALPISIVVIGPISKIVVTPNELTVKYIFLPKLRVFDYRDIESNKNFSGQTGRQGALVGYRKQEITFNNGWNITYTSLKFDNYDDLKNHIYWYMVEANQQQAEINSHT